MDSIVNQARIDVGSEIIVAYLKAAALKDGEKQ
jgi:hypothetical protein